MKSFNEDRIVMESLYSQITEKNTYEERQYTPDRIPRGAKSAYEGSGGKKLKIATSIAYRVHQAIQKNKESEFSNIPERGKRQEQKFRIGRIVKPLEEKYLRQWAEKQNILMSNEDFNAKWTTRGKISGAENEAYFDEDSQRWFKRNNLSYHTTFLDFFYRIAMHNSSFPEAPVKLEGFVDNEGELQPIISQPHVRAERGATPEEVEKLMTKIGFQKDPDPLKPHDYYNPKTGIKVEDLHDENVLVGEDGLLYVVDPVIYLDDDGKVGRVTSNEPLEFELAA